MQILDINSLGTAVQLHDTCFVYFYGSWSRHRSEVYVKDISAMAAAERRFHFAYHVQREQDELVVLELGVTELPVVVTFSLGEAEVRSYVTHPLPLRHPKSDATVLAPLRELSELSRAVSSGETLTLFIAGDRSSVGKSTFALFLMASLVEMGFAPSALAYIKPVTQCEAEQPISVFCNRLGIACRGIGPVVFYSGFTRAFLDESTKTTVELLQDVRSAVAEISVGKTIVLVDGVGYPSVGSICGLSNADCAAVLGAPVLLVGKSGVGDAVDSFNLNSSYFESKGVHVIGTVFNKIPLSGFYSLEASKPFILSYFDKYRPQYQVYGFVPVMDAAGNEGDLAILNSENLNVFARHVDLRSILKDIWSFSAYHRRPGDLLVYQLPGFREELENSVDVETNDRPSRGAGRIGNLDPLRSIYLRDDSQKYLRTDGDSNDRDLERASKRMKLHTREEIQRVAMSSGASGG